MAGAAIHALLLGILLLPLSIAGMVFMIGVLGFSPFLTAFSLWRNACRAYKQAGTGLHSNRKSIAILGLSLACLVPWNVQSYVNSRIAVALLRIESNDPRGLEFFQNSRWLVNADALVAAYQKETGESRQQRIADAYRAVTGKDIEEELAMSD